MMRQMMWWALVLGLVGNVAAGEERMIEDFKNNPAARWAFISDQVMGGVSTGTVALEEVDGQVALRLTGTVSTKNNGGFIQARLKLAAPLAEEAQGLELRVRGNGEKYYVHLRTGGTVLPWNFYQASFEAGEDWATVRIPFAEFKAQGRLLRRELTAGAVKSIAVVAYGADYEADVTVARVTVY